MSGSGFSPHGYLHIALTFFFIYIRLDAEHVTWQRAVHRKLAFLKVQNRQGGPVAHASWMALRQSVAKQHLNWLTSCFEKLQIQIITWSDPIHQTSLPCFFLSPLPTFNLWPSDLHLNSIFARLCNVILIRPQKSRFDFLWLVLQFICIYINKLITKSSWYLNIWDQLLAFSDIRLATNFWVGVK